MSGKLGAKAAAILLSLMLAACGGDDNSSCLSGVCSDGDSGNGDGNGDVVVGSINLFSDSPQIGTASDSQVTLTATVQDSNGILLSDIPVSFTTSDGALEVVTSETDANGTASAVLKNPFDPRNRTINVTATAGGKSDTVGVLAAGTSIAITGPTAVSLGTTASYTVRLTDSAGKGISGEQISISSTGSNSLAAATDTTGATGNLTLNFTANTGGTDEITVSAYSGTSRVEASIEVTVDDDSFLFSTPDQNATVNLNTPETLTVQLNTDGTPVAGMPITFSATRGTLSASQATTDSSGQASVTISSSTAGPSLVTATTSGGLSATRQIQFVATNPTSMIIQADNTQLRPQQETEITAVLRDANNNLVQGQPVTFNIASDESNGELLESQAVTDALGRATVTYRAGTGSTASGGVIINGSTTAGTQPTAQIALTVGGQALRITLGTGNEILEPDNVRYEREWVAFVTDVSGGPVEGATVELKLLPISYGKGYYIQVDVDGDGEPDVWSANRTVTCPGEDVNSNGLKDPGEDINGNGTLDPSNDATFTPQELTTAEDGSADFSLLYPQSNCSWTDFRLVATVEVAGSESIGTAQFTLSCSAPDLSDIEVSPPGGVVSKYGQSTSCSDPD